MPYQGSRVVRLADVPAKEWLEALRGKGEAGAKRLAALLAKLFTTFRIDVVTPDGKELPITVTKP